ncbi:UBC-like protein [Hygrophoropsis aurantiaca]|uniref:UBC-like protein n=1 Tax=Hygrophoropsis aurantiaca TaxID=72124 RepID=A0ACB8A6K2_9AGAM|nr:UBC-like protein [Hygrophoropsis aurantiaca]
MASKAAQKRLTKEYVTMQREPPPFVWAVPDEKNILTWNYLIRGPPDSPFAGGEYHGVLLFPPEYPFKPPGIKMFTPSGRFQPDKKICFSMSDFHPGSWNPAWSVQTILTGLLSFMLSDEMTTGSVTSSDGHKLAFAARSHLWNVAQTRFKEAFPDHCGPTLRDLPNMGERERGKPETVGVAVKPVSPSSAYPSPISPSTSTPTAMTTTTTTATGTTTATSQLPRLIQRTAVAETAEVPATNASGNTNTSMNAGGNGALSTSNNANAKWPASWRQVIWEKWRWGVLIALAVIVSRMSSSS